MKKQRSSGDASITRGHPILFACLAVAAIYLAFAALVFLALVLLVTLQSRVYLGEWPEVLLSVIGFLFPIPLLPLLLCIEKRLPVEKKALFSLRFFCACPLVACGLTLLISYYLLPLGVAALLSIAALAAGYLACALFLLRLFYGIFFKLTDKIGRRQS